MKSIFLIGLIALSLTAKAEVNSCQTKNPGSDCEVVKVFTRCDLDKQKLRRKIAQLEQRIKELESRPKETNTVYVETVKKEVNKETVEKTVMKHNILSLYMTRDVSSWNNSNGELKSGFEPGLKYQYEFNMGLVPEIGINLKGDPLFALGFEF